MVRIQDQFNFLQGLVIDSHKNIYVANGNIRTTTGRIVKIGSDGTHLATWNISWGVPIGLAINLQDQVYVATYLAPQYNGVSRLDTHGNIIQTWPIQAAGVMAVDPQSSIYVVDASTTPRQLIKYASNGTRLQAFSTKPALEATRSVALDSTGNIYLTESSLSGQQQSGIFQLGPDGTQIAYINTTQIFRPPSHPSQLAVDTQNNIYVADTLASQVVKLDKSGQVMTRYDITGGPIRGLVIDFKNNAVDIYAASSNQEVVILRNATSSETSMSPGSPQAGGSPESRKDPLPQVVSTKCLQDEVQTQGLKSDQVDLQCRRLREQLHAQQQEMLYAQQQQLRGRM